MEAQATGALLWKMIAGAMGLVRKSGGQIWTRTRFCLIGGANLGLRPLIFDFCRRVSMCRRLKDYGRDRLAFSVSGWRQVSAHQDECSGAQWRHNVWSRVANKRWVYGGPPLG